MTVETRRLPGRSRWLPMALAIATATGSLPAPAVHAQSTTVRCESKDGQRVTWLGGNGWGNGDNRIVRCESRKDKRRTCAIRKGSDVEMRRQLSDRPCNRGSSWGKEREYIWVDRGCRAEFWVRD